MVVLLKYNQVYNLFGTDILTVSINSSDYSLDYTDMDEILEIDNVDSVAPYKNVSGTVSRDSTTSSSSSIIATNNNYLDVTNIKLAIRKKTFYYRYRE